MYKKKHKLQICAHSSLNLQQQQEQCIYCFNNSDNNLRSKQIEDSLLAKYGKSGIDASESSNYSRFVQGKSQIYQGGYQQFKKYYSPINSIKTYYNIKETSQKITGIIRQNLEKDRLMVKYFKGKYLLILYRNYQIKKGEKMDIKNSDNIRSTEAGDLKKQKKSGQKQKKELICFQKKKKKQIEQNCNESFEQIIRLRKTLDKMCSKFKGDNFMNAFHRQMELKKLSQQKKFSKKKKILFSSKIERKISQIKSAGSNSRSKYKNCQRVQTQTQFIYGLNRYSKKKSGSNEKKDGYNMNYRVQTDKPIQNMYDSPVSRAYYARNYLNTEKSSIGCKKKSKDLTKSRSKKSFSSKSQIRSFQCKKNNADLKKDFGSTATNSHLNAKKKLSKQKKKNNN